MGDKLLQHQLEPMLLSASSALLATPSVTSERYFGTYEHMSVVLPVALPLLLPLMREVRLQWK
jgi:hypothetical protein